MFEVSLIPSTKNIVDKELYEFLPQSFLIHTQILPISKNKLDIRFFDGKYLRIVTNIYGKVEYKWMISVSTPLTIKYELANGEYKPYEDGK